jgi:hypothetical protein
MFYLAHRLLHKALIFALLIFETGTGFAQIDQTNATTTKWTGSTNPVNKKLTATLRNPGPANQQKAALNSKEIILKNSAKLGGGNQQVSALTLRTWTGATNNTFNTATNWNPNGIPSPTDSCVIILAANATISLNAASTVGALYVSLSGNTHVLRIDAVSFALTINGTTTLKATGGNANTQVQMNVGNGASITYGGALTCTGFNSNQGIIYPVLGAGGTTGTVTFKGDVTYNNAVASSSTNLPGTVIFDATGAQTINNVSSLFVNTLAPTVLFGSANTPTVTITGLQATWFTTGDATVKAGASLILPGGNGTTTGGTFCHGTSFPNPASGGTFTMGAGAVLKVGDLQGDYGSPTGTYGGVSGSNFPGSFSTYALNATSISDYNSLTGVNQTIYNTPTYGSLTLTNGSGSGATTKTAGGNLTMNGDVTINTLATFDGSTSSHSLKGNWTNAGTFTGSTSTVTFNGTAALQTISGASVTTFNNLTINNSSGSGVTLSAAANVSNTLALTTGLLNTTATNILTMQNGSTAPALTAASTSYVNGPLKYQKSTSGSSVLNFPVGTSPDCRSFILTVNHLDVTPYNYTAQTFNANAGSLGYSMAPTTDTISGVHYWTIDRTDGGGTSAPATGLVGNQTVKFYFGTNDFVYEGSELTIVKNVSGGTQWFDVGGAALNSAGGAWANSGAPQAGSVSTTSSPSAFTSFSTFTLASLAVGWNSLPIELLSFSAVPNNDRVDIKWSTATETNNDHFTIEKSKDGKIFTKLIDVKGAGNSTSLKEYFDIDQEPYIGTSYYRLKQTDKNGAYKYFYMVPVTFNGNKNITLFPNPIGKGEPINIKVTGYPNQEVLVVLRDMSGEEFSSKVLLTEESNHIFSVSTLTEIPAGTYLVVASSNNKIYSYKLVVR